eukprot:6753104-Alexandrium_andersonii.AAC.1
MSASLVGSEMCIRDSVHLHRARCCKREPALCTAAPCACVLVPGVTMKLPDHAVGIQRRRMQRSCFTPELE